MFKVVKLVGLGMLAAFASAAYAQIGAPSGAPYELNVNWYAAPAPFTLKTLGTGQYNEAIVEFTNSSGTRFPTATENCRSNWYYVQIGTTFSLIRSRAANSMTLCLPRTSAERV